MTIRKRYIRPLLVAGFLMSACSSANSTPCTLGANRISFLAARDSTQAENQFGGLNLYVMNVDGSCQTRITNNALYFADTVWSSDGRHVLINSLDPNGRTRSFSIMDADGTNARLLDSIPPDAGFVKWSADGKAVIFTSVGSEFTIDIDPSNGPGTPVKGKSDSIISTFTQFDYSSSFSPDGSRVAFVSGTINSDHAIYLENTDGSNKKRLNINFPTHPDDPARPAISNNSPLAWSPDGTRLAFVSGLDGSGDIYVISVVDALMDKGSDPLNATNNPAADGSPAWSPDGNKIVFVSNRNPYMNYGVFIMNADGSHVVQLTDNRADVVIVDPQWVTFKSN